MSNWWKDPRLDDEGTYDYLVEELPKDYARWEVSKYRWRCDNCGKESHVRFCTAHYFYCWDGWDSMSWNECWCCRLKGYIHGIRWKIKKGIKDRIEAFKLSRDLHKGTPVWSFKYCYGVAKKIVR